jgi:hypothetical protein
VPDDASWLDGVVVPDDLSELQVDVEAYHRELRHAARRRRMSRITRTSAWQRLALPAAVAVGSLTVAGAVFAILTLGHPTRMPTPPPAPVATAPAADAGEVGGLLADVTVRTSDGPMQLRDLRPSLIALVPLHCNCTSLLAALASQAAEVAVPLVVVAPAGHDAEVDALAGQLHSGVVRTAFDVNGELSRTYATGIGVTVVGVRSDATVSFAEQDVAANIHLEPWLTQMVRPTESLSGR